MKEEEPEKEVIDNRKKDSDINVVKFVENLEDKIRKNDNILRKSDKAATLMLRPETKKFLPAILSKQHWTINKVTNKKTRYSLLPYFPKSLEVKTDTMSFCLKK